MRKEYDFSNSIKNPYAKRVKKQISIRIETDTIEYFKKLVHNKVNPANAFSRYRLKN